MAGENSIQQHNPHPELEDVWRTYNQRSDAWIQDRIEKGFSLIQDRIEKGFPLPPTATYKRMQMLKTILTLRAIGVLESPT